jgi:hypothetical protein
MSTRTTPLRSRPRPDVAAFDDHPLGTVVHHEPPVPSPGVGFAPSAGRSTAVRGSLESLDWRQALGGALIVLGMLAIIVSWFGVSGTLDPGEQMPYISSGGFGGSALIAIGVTLLISFEHSRDRDALAQVLDELDDVRSRLDRLDPGRAGQPGVDRG